MKTDMFEKQSRYVVYLFVSPWKIFIFMFLFLTFSVVFGDVATVEDMFTEFSDSFKVSRWGRGHAI